MRYNESHSSKFLGSAGFYIIIACCLIAIGGASWFAISKYNQAQNPENPSSSQESRAYNSSDNSYNESGSASIPNVESKTPSANVGNAVSDEPYETKAPEAEYFAPPVEGNITKGYSETELQYSSTYGDMRIHTGTDIVCEAGVDVKAAGDGTVLSVDESATLGTVVTIDHGNGLTAKYCGLCDVKVSANDTVKLGTIIGAVSTVPSECADQSHIHIEVYKDGKITSPLEALGLQ